MPAAEGADGDMFGGVTVAAPSCSQGRPVPAAEGADGDMFGRFVVVVYFFSDRNICVYPCLGQPFCRDFLFFFPQVIL